ncbi:hypothetical protein RI129_005784 [Pyrocoelia pectoralis]|uniref:Uncharacterized protein n=1 Tax=Pyrocoelia pectoralis TaxID=417401 RepID=A0AAN7VE12_9COLE
MLDPPCTVVPFEPKYVKPLQMPSPPLQKCESEAEGLRNRTLNFYNNYNIDYHLTGDEFKCKKIPKRNMPHYTATVGGRFPNSPHTGEECIDEGCPTGFKPCKMKLCPPIGCHPLGTWYASIQPCSPKAKRRGKNKQ